MIKVPEPVKAVLLSGYQLHPSDLTFLGGGRIDSDGIAYTFTREGQNFVLKILAFLVDDTDALVRLEERLKFIHFLGDRGAPIVSPLEGVSGGLYTTHAENKNLFVAYVYKKVEGGTVGETVWLDPIARPWGASVGSVHRITQEYPNWQMLPKDGRLDPTIPKCIGLARRMAGFL